ncbi:hypothetical protein Ciccas_000901 [Cichlidogyrus casuarinus]|uniref:Uncharacterized protein n=1 Tax=Cichlidogyrus casuarinus TaxID=1844966 RepID=A0ABD2QLV5_9PLAT
MEYAVELQARGFVMSGVQSQFTGENIEKEWSNMIFTFPQDVSIWRSYIGYVKSCATHLGFKRINSAYQRALSTLNGIITGRMLSHKPKPSTFLDAIDFFFEYCFWLREVGYREKALAYLVALVEFNCFIPDRVIQQSISFRSSVSSGHTAKFNFELIWESFTEFWYSESPKIGQPCAEGWSDFYSPVNESRESVSAPVVADETILNTAKYLQLLQFEKEPLNEWKKSLMELVVTGDAVEDCLMHMDFDVADSALDGLGPSRTRGLAWSALENSREEIGLFSATFLGLNTAQLEDEERAVGMEEIRTVLIEIALMDPKHGNYRTAAAKRIILLFLAFLGLIDSRVCQQFRLPVDLEMMHDLTEVQSIEDQQFLEPDVNFVYDRSAQSTINFQMARLKRKMITNTLTSCKKLFADDSTWQNCLKELQMKLLRHRLKSALVNQKISAKNAFSVYRLVGKETLATDPDNLQLWLHYAETLISVSSAEVFQKEAKSIFEKAGKLFPLSLQESHLPIEQDESWWRDNFTPRLALLRLKFTWVSRTEDLKKVLTILSRSLGKSNQNGFLNRLVALAVTPFVETNCGFSAKWLTTCASTLAFLHFMYQLCVHDEKVITNSGDFQKLN